MVFHLCLHLIWRLSFNNCHLCYTSEHTLQQQAIVKFYGVFASHWRSLAFAPEWSGSGASSWGQRKSRYAIHARRHSSDKAFRYLKRITVIPAVCQSLASLKRSLRYWYWADVTDYTSLYRLAISYVFVKQSDFPSYCTLRSQSYNHNHRDSLNRSYRAKLPNSLN